MDDALLRKVSRQLKLLNFVVTFFGLLILASFIIAAVLVFKAASVRALGGDQNRQPAKTSHPEPRRSAANL